MVAVALPFNPYVVPLTKNPFQNQTVEDARAAAVQQEQLNVNSGDLDAPGLPAAGEDARWENQANEFALNVFTPEGFEVETLVRLPYLCQLAHTSPFDGANDAGAAFVALDTAVFVLQKSGSECPGDGDGRPHAKQI